MERVGLIKNILGLYYELDLTWLILSLTCSYQSDYEAWSELCDLYISEMDYSKAAFCMEELILSNPHNHLYMQKYAEVRTGNTGKHRGEGGGLHQPSVGHQTMTV